MGHVRYVDLGNAAPGPMTNFGGFENVQPNFYWSSTRVLDGQWMFGFHVGVQGYSPDFQPNYALAVRDGDVTTSIPEPETYALLLGGWPR